MILVDRTSLPSLVSFCGGFESIQFSLSGVVVGSG
jgi:hypothetical protein